MTGEFDRSILMFFVAHLIDERRKQGISYRDIADDFGISHVTAQKLHKLETGVGSHLEDLTARRLTNGSNDELRRRATDWRREHQDWLPPGVSRPDGPKKYSDLAWWPAAEKEAMERYRHLDWAIFAARDLPVAIEPRPDRQTAEYVAELANLFLSEDPERQRELDQRYRHWRRRNQPQHQPQLQPMPARKRSAR